MVSSRCPGGLLVVSWWHPRGLSGRPGRRGGCGCPSDPGHHGRHGAFPLLGDLPWHNLGPSLVCTQKPLPTKKSQAAGGSSKDAVRNAADEVPLD